MKASHLLALLAACAATEVSAATIIHSDFDDFERPDVSQATDQVLAFTQFSQSLSAALIDDLRIRPSAFGVLLGEVFAVWEALQGADLVLEVARNSKDIESLNDAVVFSDRYKGLRNRIEELETQAIAAQQYLGSFDLGAYQLSADIEGAVVLDPTARRLAEESLSELLQISPTLSDVNIIAQEIAAEAKALSDEAQRLALASEQTFELLIDSPAFATGAAAATGLLQKLAQNKSVLDSISATAGGLSADAAKIANDSQVKLTSVATLRAGYQEALSHHIATTSYSFSGSFPNSPPSACGYIGSFASSRRYRMTESAHTQEFWQALYRSL